MPSKPLSHPYQNLPSSDRWLRGNLHTHTTRSDGRREPQAVIDDYAARGYHFLMISDHDCVFEEGELTRFDSRGMVLIPGNEITSNGPHLLHVATTRLVDPYDDRQHCIQEAVKGGGFIIVNHPNWGKDFAHCPIERLESWTGYAGLEIYNGTVGRLPGSPYATDKWDRLLSLGRRVWAYANDDSHLPKDDVGLGWNVVCADSSDPESIVEALRTGRFYASTGVVIRSIEVEGGRIRLETENAERIVAIGDHGKRLAQVDEREMVFTVPAKAGYVRFECWGRGEQFAWTQPFVRETGGRDRS